MMPLARSSRIRRALLLATGQITSYGSGAGMDDGALQKGVVKTYTILTTGRYSGTTSITINGKTDVHSNNCVVDNNTGLMWSRYAAASVGPASDGKLSWTTNASGEGIFTYAAAANVALLAGYGDDPDPAKNWRPPNLKELMSLADYTGANCAPDSTAFPSFAAVEYWASTSRPDNPTIRKFWFTFASSSLISPVADTGNFQLILVRG